MNHVSEMPVLFFHTKLGSKDISVLPEKSQNEHGVFLLFFLNGPFQGTRADVVIGRDCRRACSQGLLPLRSHHAVLRVKATTSAASSMLSLPACTSVSPDAHAYLSLRVVLVLFASPPVPSYCPLHPTLSKACPGLPPPKSCFLLKILWQSLYTAQHCVYSLCIHYPGS